MKYPATFADDLKYLSAFYEWTDEDKKEVRAAFTDSEPTVRFLTNLAACHRAGYVQGAGNGFMRLQTWCASHGLPDPFGPEFDVAALDWIKVEAA